MAELTTVQRAEVQGMIEASTRVLVDDFKKHLSGQAKSFTDDFAASRTEKNNVKDISHLRPNPIQTQNKVAQTYR